MVSSGAVVPRSRRQVIAGFLTPLFLVVVSGCATLEPIDPDSPADLGPREGLLIIDIDTEVPIKDLSAGSLGLGEIKPGRMTWIARAPAGRYRWTELEIVSQGNRPIRFELKKESELEFSVVPGKINYPGQITVRRYFDAGLLIENRLYVRNRNHAGMTLRALRKTHALILRDLPITNSGTTKDLFVEHYSQRIQSLEREKVVDAVEGDVGVENP